MHVVFKQAVCIGDKDFSRGAHNVPVEVQQHPYFLKLVNLGLVVEAEASKVISPQTMQDRQKALADKLMKAQPKVVAAPVKEEIPPIEDAQPEEDFDAVDQKDDSDVSFDEMSDDDVVAEDVVDEAEVEVPKEAKPKKKKSKKK